MRAVCNFPVFSFSLNQVNGGDSLPSTVRRGYVGSQRVVLKTNTAYLREIMEPYAQQLGIEDFLMLARDLIQE